MNSKIPSAAEVAFWFNEATKHPSFVETLSTYEKNKLLEYCEERIDSALRGAIRFFEATTAANYPEGWPEEKQLEYVVYNNARGNFAPTVRVLNALGFNWNLKEGFTRLTPDKPANQPETTPPKKLIEIAPSVIPDLIECLKEYFLPEEETKLKALLNGQPIEGRVNFKLQQNQLAEVFYRLKQKQLLLNTIDVASSWLAEFFNYKNGGQFIPCKKTSVSDVFSKQKTPTQKNKIICNKIGL